MVSPKPAFICASCSRALRQSSKSLRSARELSISSRSQLPASSTASQFQDRKQIPRWQQTPPAMKMPFRVRPLPDQPEWKVNHDPKVLDTALDRYIGSAAGPGLQGSNILPAEVKWLATTHKSFEQGARGFNDRLAFLGKRIVDVEACKALLAIPTTTSSKYVNETIDGQARIGPRQQHPALEGVENITSYAKESRISPAKLSQLASRYGITKAVRWQPKQVEHLAASGVEGVMASAMYAVIGAIALQRGGDVAIEVVKQRILKPLGL